jgi:hypothetical protein
MSAAALLDTIEEGSNASPSTCFTRSATLELVARETNVSIARLAEWRERALAGAATALKERERDDRDDEIARLKSKVGEITDNELLYAKIEALEGKRPLACQEVETMSQILPPPWLVSEISFEGCHSLATHVKNLHNFYVAASVPRRGGPTDAASNRSPRPVP